MVEKKHSGSGMSLNIILLLAMMFMVVVSAAIFLALTAAQGTFVLFDRLALWSLEEHSREMAGRARDVLLQAGPNEDGRPYLEIIKDGLRAEEHPFEGGFCAAGRMGAGVIRPSWLFALTPEGEHALSLAGGQIGLLPADPEVPGVFLATGELEGMFIAASGVGAPSEFETDSVGYMFAFAPAGVVHMRSEALRRGLVMSVCALMAMALAAALFLSRSLTKKIRMLTVEVVMIDPEMPLELSPIGIREIDGLSAAMSRLGKDVQRRAARMSTIVDLVDIPMGAFEVLPGGHRVFMTDSLFRLLEIPHVDGESQYIAYSRFETCLPGLSVYEREDSFQLDFEWTAPDSGKELWLRISTSRRDGHVYGTIMDISDEVSQKKRLEYERNYDPLTNLLNRNSYPAKMRDMISSAPDKKGLMLFGDLDNLKVINDTFGHDMGDRYIQMAAQAFFNFERYGGVAARISGDEFVVYLHGRETRGELRELADRVLSGIRENSMTMPDGSVQKVRVSVGLAYYPDDGSDVEELISMADFAMYEIKHSQKGSTNEFDSVSFERNSYLLMKPNVLDLLIEQRRTKTAFQPIVDVRTGEIFGFEALMRPQMREFSSPGEVISIARSQAKLYQIEKLTVGNVFEHAMSQRNCFEGVRVFFNSLPNQLLTADDTREMMSLLEGAELSFVLEITEEEQSTKDVLEEKVEWARRHGFSVALDDYGSGYNSDLTLLTIKPDFIKVDLSIIRNINEDKNRQLLCKKIVDYAALYEMKIIAEGVETREELDMVISLGVDYVQGFYLGRPQFSPVPSIPEYIRAEILEIFRRRFEWGLYGDNI